MIRILHCTDLPTKNETSETTVRNIFSLFCYNNGSLMIYISFFHPKIFIKCHKKSVFRSLLKPRPLWVTLHVLPPLFVFHKNARFPNKVPRHGKEYCVYTTTLLYTFLWHLRQSIFLEGTRPHDRTTRQDRHYLYSTYKH